jgi:hypothetical protein
METQLVAKLIREIQSLKDLLKIVYVEANTIGGMSENTRKTVYCIVHGEEEEI